MESNSFGARLFLIGFGLSIGLVTSLIAWNVLRGSLPEGSEFATLDDLRRAMLRPDAPVQGSESVKLHALVTPHESDRIIYELRPGLNVRFQQVPVSTNSCGMRNPETSIAKDFDTYRIALLGDSFAFGWGVEQDKIFAKVLEDNLNRLGGGAQKFEVLNFGVPGYSTFQEVEKFIVSDADFDPDAVLVFFISNDFGLPFFVHNVNEPGSMMSGVEFAKLSWKKEDPAIEQQRRRLQSFDPNKALAQLSDFTQERGIKLLLAINPKKDAEDIRRRLGVLERRKDIQLVPLREAFMHTYLLNGYAEEALTLPTDPHPSALRHRIFGDILTPYFMEALL